MPQDKKGGKADAGPKAQVVNAAKICPTCRASLISKSNCQVHFESKHPKLPVPDYDKL